MFGNLGTKSVVRWSPDSTLLLLYGNVPFTSFYMLDQTSPNQGHMAALTLVDANDQVITGGQVDLSSIQLAIDDLKNNTVDGASSFRSFNFIDVLGSVDGGTTVTYKLLLNNIGSILNSGGSAVDHFSIYSIFDLVVNKSTKRATLTLVANHIYAGSKETVYAERTYDHESGTLFTRSISVKPGDPALPAHTVTRHNISGNSMVRAQKVLSEVATNPIAGFTLFRRQGSSALYLATMEVPAVAPGSNGIRVHANLYKVSTDSINDTDITHLGSLGEWDSYGTAIATELAWTEITYEQRTGILTIWHPFRAGGGTYTVNAEGTVLSATGMKLNFSSDDTFTIGPEPGDQPVALLAESMGSQVSGSQVVVRTESPVLSIPTSDIQPWSWTGGIPVGAESSNRTLSFAKVLTLPATPVANCFYMTPDATSGLRLTVSDAVGRVYRSTMRETTIDSEIVRMVARANELKVVATYTDLTNSAFSDSTFNRNQIYYVLDASGDPSVVSGPAMYILDWTTGTVHKIAEGVAENFSPDWTTVLGRPASEIVDIDDAVTKRHSHANLAELNSVTVDGDQVLVSGTALRPAVRTAIW